MKSILLLIPCVTSLAAGETHVIAKPAVAGHKVEVRISLLPFKPSAHKISKKNPGANELILVDGSCARGTDYQIPRIEISSVSVQFDGERFALPPALFKDCYNLDHRPESVRAVLAEDGSSLLIVVRGGDGAAAYSIGWLVRRNGSHTRFLDLLISIDPENNDV